LERFQWDVVAAAGTRERDGVLPLFYDYTLIMFEYFPSFVLVPGTNNLGKR